MSKIEKQSDSYKKKDGGRYNQCYQNKQTLFK